MKFVSWNVNGLRACMGKGFMDSFEALDADFFCLQETKLQAGQITMELPGYHQYWCYAEKKGYSGTAIFTRYEPLSVTYGLGIPELDTEGRVITLEYEEFYLVTCYTPNAQRGLARIDHRLKWEEAFRQYLKELDGKKPVILCGDLNVAHQEIDLKNPASNRGNAGFSDQERSAFTALLDSGFTDSFRHLYPDKTGAYSWWSYMFNARQNNAGWRIDYFVVSNRLAEAIHDATIHPDILGSDHCPVGLDLNTTCNGGIRFPTSDTQQPQQPKEADGNNPVGLGRMLLTLALVVAVTALTVTAIRRHEPGVQKETNPVMVTVPMASNASNVTPQGTQPLVCKVIDRTGSVTLALGDCSPTVSSIDQYFVAGEERWRLEPAFVSDFMMRHPANFHIQLPFSEDYGSSVADCPEVSYVFMRVIGCEYDGYYIEQCYYYEADGSVGGCFVYGYLPHGAFLQIQMKHNGRKGSSEIFPVTPAMDLTDYSTEELADLIESFQIVEKSRAFGNGGNLSDVIQYDPYLQELLGRPNAISVMIAHCGGEECELKEYLRYSAFQALMTEEQKEAYPPRLFIELTTMPI